MDMDISAYRRTLARAGRSLSFAQRIGFVAICLTVLVRATEDFFLSRAGESAVRSLSALVALLWDSAERAVVTTTPQSLEGLSLDIESIVWKEGERVPNDLARSEQVAVETLRCAIVGLSALRNNPRPNDVADAGLCVVNKAFADIIWDPNTHHDDPFADSRFVGMINRIDQILEMLRRLECIQRDIMKEVHIL